MIFVKTAEEIELLRESNQLVGLTLGEMAKHIRPGVSTLELDRIAEEFIRSHGALPAFKGYEGLPYVRGAYTRATNRPRHAHLSHDPHA